jgi:hypothetical protein
MTNNQNLTNAPQSVEASRVASKSKKSATGRHGGPAQQHPLRGASLTNRIKRLEADLIVARAQADAVRSISERTATIQRHEANLAAGGYAAPWLHPGLELPDALIEGLARHVVSTVVKAETARTPGYEALVDTLYMLRHESGLPVVQRFLAGVAAATGGRLRTLEDVLRSTVATTIAPRGSYNAAKVRLSRAAKSRHRKPGPDFHPALPSFFVGFHGTRSVDSAISIAAEGFDPARRSGQALGPGEYFGRHPSTAYEYDMLGGLALVVLLLRDGNVVTNRDDVTRVVVMRNPMSRQDGTYCLPVGLIGARAAEVGPLLDAHRTRCVSAHAQRVELESDADAAYETLLASEGAERDAIGKTRLVLSPAAAEAATLSAACTQLKSTARRRRARRNRVADPNAGAMVRLPSA